MKMKNNTKKLKGFTLIELIVVIAIIGALAGILIPSLIGYVRKAEKRTDSVNAKQIYEDAQLLLLTDSEACDSFYKHNTTKFDVTVNAGKENAESYKLVVVCKSDGRAFEKKDGSTPTLPMWTQGNNEAKGFCDAMNKYTAISADKYLTPVKYHNKNTAGYEANRWIICYRDKDKEKIEIWVADATKTYGCQPVYRLYPNPDSEYA